MSQSQAPLNEGWAITPMFVDNLVAVIPVGAVTHLVFAVSQPVIETTSRMERTVQARLIVPSDLLPVFAKAMLRGRMELPNEAGEERPLH
jgi:hypothetical protein